MRSGQVTVLRRATLSVYIHYVYLLPLVAVSNDCVNMLYVWCLVNESEHQGPQQE